MKNTNYNYNALALPPPTQAQFYMTAGFFPN